MQALILFDDGHEPLSPLTDLRASFELRTGALTTTERLADRAGRHPDALIVPDGLADLIAERHTEPVNALPTDRFDEYLILNGRWTAIDSPLPVKLNTAQVDPDGSLVAALLDRTHAERFVASRGRIPDGISAIPHTADSPSPLLRRPWHILDHAETNLSIDMPILARRLTPLDGEPAPRVTIVGDHPVLIGRGTIIHPHVVFDTSAGPIAIDNGAEVRSMSILVGPGYVGRGSIVTNHAHIRGRCVIGPVCKVGGEVNASLFQGYANKAHGGYLGDSFVGEWVNIGADTNTSNLKNTYGQVRMQTRPGHPAEPTGRTNLGSILGDHVKTAIGTRLNTGSCIHTGAMVAVAAFPPKRVERFAFLTDENGKDGGATRYDFDRFCATADEVMTRRGMGLSEPLRRRLRQLYEARSVLSG